MKRFSLKMKVSLLCVCHVLTIVVCHELILNSGNIESVLTPGEHPPPSSDMWDIECPDKCTCVKGIPKVTRTFNNLQFKVKMKTVNCSIGGFSSVPRNLPSDTEVLFLNGNSIIYFTKFPYVPNMKYLDISDNQIKTMDTNVFSQMIKLKYLSLRNNTLEQLLQGGFSGLLDLDHLDISDNKLHNIASHAFAGLNHLKVLEIKSNRLAAVNPDWFEDMLDVNILKLSHNVLINISEKLFHNLHNLNILDLSDNNITLIHEHAFATLNKLRILNVSNNMLTRVPTKLLQSCTSVTNVLLDGNQIKRLATGDISMMNITVLSVSYMNSLILIEKFAFRDLPSLVNLQIHDNPNLIYIDHEAIGNTPNLKRLYAHNDQLSAFSRDILDHVPNLVELHLYNNPLRCDCNALWIKERLESAEVTNNSRPLIHNSKSVTCDFPLNVTGDSIEDVDEDIFGRVCAPTTLELLNESYSLDAGEELLLECHAFGVPNPTMYWTLPNGTVIDDKANNEKAQVVNGSVLIIRHLTTLDSGTYSCISDNGIGYDIGSTHIHVINKPVRIIANKIASDYVSVSWNGTKENAMISGYQLRYSLVELAGDHHFNHKSKFTPYNAINIGLRYHNYTVTNLQPKTMYAFCIVYVSNAEYYNADCVNITTSKGSNTNRPVSHADTDMNTVIYVILCTVLVITCTLVCVILVARKQHGRKYYATRYDPDEVEPVNIQMDTIYPSLTVPLYSSRTALLDEHGKERDDY